MIYTIDCLCSPDDDGGDHVDFVAHGCADVAAAVAADAVAAGEAVTVAVAVADVGVAVAAVVADARAVYSRPPEICVLVSPLIFRRFCEDDVRNRSRFPTRKPPPSLFRNHTFANACQSKNACRVAAGRRQQLYIYSIYGFGSIQPDGCGTPIKLNRVLF